MADQQRAIDIVDGVVVGIESTRDCIAGRNCIGVAIHGGRRHRAGAGQGDSANGFTGHQTYRGESRCAQDQRVAEYLGGIVGRDGQRGRGDIGPGDIGPQRRPEGGKELKDRIEEAAFVGDQLFNANILGVEQGIADCPQGDRRRRSGDIGLETTDRCVAQAVVNLVVTQAEHPGFGIQGSAAGQVQTVGEDFSVGQVVTHRVETDAQITRTYGDAVDAAGNQHGATENRTRPGTVIVGTQDDIAGGYRHGRVQVDVLPGDSGEVTRGNGRGRVDIDVIDGDKTQATGGGGDVRIDVDVAPGVGHQAA